VVDNGVTAQTACFDLADRLVNYTEAAVTTAPVYDYRGRVTGMGGDSFVYDQADRHISTAGAGAATVTYTRDAGGGIVARSEGGATVRYSGGAVEVFLTQRDSCWVDSDSSCWLSTGCCW
jgi:uncharacterized protein RhaS with RHS repeats